MKTLKKVPIELVIIPDNEFIPKELEFGKMYYSKEYGIANHLCLCGCGTKAPIPIKEDEWSITNNNGRLTVKPSLQQRFECKSHYIITNGIANFV
jgi:hypothetical protein